MLAGFDPFTESFRDLRRGVLCGATAGHAPPQTTHRPISPPSRRIQDFTRSGRGTLEPLTAQ